MASIKDKFKDILGTEVFTNASNIADDAINAAIGEVANLVPTELLLKYAPEPTLLDGDPATLSVTGKKVLLVQKEDLENNLVTCMEMNPIDFAAAGNDKSMYEATNLSPVFSIHYLDGSGILDMRPRADSTYRAFVHLFTYPTTVWSASSAATFENLPEEIEQAILYRAALSVIQAYISNAVEEEEDVEMQTMLNNQMQSLQALYQTEIAPFTQGVAT